MKPPVTLAPEDIRNEIQEYIRTSPFQGKIQSIALFGSYAKNEAKGDSDIDLLISFSDRIGYFTLVRIQNALSQRLHQEVDLVTKETLSRHFRDEVLRKAIVVYEK